MLSDVGLSKAPPTYSNGIVSAIVGYVVGKTDSLSVVVYNVYLHYKEKRLAAYDVLLSRL